MGFVFAAALPFLLGAWVMFLGVRSATRERVKVGLVLAAEGLALAFLHLAPADSGLGMKLAYALLSGLTCCTLLYSVYASRRDAGTAASVDGIAAVVLGALAGMLAFDHFSVRVVATDEATGFVVGLVLATVAALLADRLARR